MCVVGSVMAKYLILEVFVGCWISCDFESYKHPDPGSLVHHIAKFS